VHLAGRVRAAEAGEHNVLLPHLHRGQCQASAALPAETQLLEHSACPFLNGLKHTFLLVVICSQESFSRWAMACGIIPLLYSTLF